MVKGSNGVTGVKVNTAALLVAATVPTRRVEVDNCFTNTVDVLIVSGSIAVLNVIEIVFSNSTSTALSIGSVAVTSGQSPIIPTGSSDFLQPTMETKKSIINSHLFTKIGVILFFIFLLFI